MMTICEIHGLPMSEGLCADCEEIAEEIERQEVDLWEQLLDAVD